MVEGAARAPHAPARTCRAHVRPVDRPVSFSTRIKSYICVCQPCIGDKPKNFGITIRHQPHSPRSRENKFVKNQQQPEIKIFLQDNFTGQKKERKKFHRISRNDNRQPWRFRQYRRAVPPAGIGHGDTTANSDPHLRHRRIVAPVQQLSGAPSLTVKHMVCGAGVCGCQSTNASYCVPATKTEIPSFLNAHFKIALLQIDKTGKGRVNAAARPRRAEKTRPGAKQCNLTACNCTTGSPSGVAQPLAFIRARRALRRLFSFQRRRFSSLSSLRSSSRRSSRSSSLRQRAHSCWIIFPSGTNAIPFCGMDEGATTPIIPGRVNVPPASSFPGPTGPSSSDAAGAPVPSRSHSTDTPVSWHIFRIISLFGRFSSRSYPPSDPLLTPIFAAKTSCDNAPRTKRMRDPSVFISNTIPMPNQLRTVL